MVLALSGTAFAAETVAAPAEKKAEVNCVKKDKKGNCPPAPKTAKPTPKKKVEAPKAAASAPVVAEPAKK